jgi:AcrR family transcriptional regulator
LVKQRRRPARDTRTALLRAAAREFADRGYDAAGTDRIAARARVNKAMLYYHFGSKRDLYLEIVRDMVATLGTRVRAIADGPGPADRKLDGWIGAIVEEAAARPWFPPIMLRELAAGAPHVDAEIVRLVNGVLAGVRDVIAQGQREGVFRDVDPLLAHLSIMPPVLMFFARQRVLARQHGLAATKLRGGFLDPRNVDEFLCHMQAAARGMLRKPS